MSRTSEPPFGILCKKVLCAVTALHEDVVKCIHGPYLAELALSGTKFSPVLLC